MIMGDVSDVCGSPDARRALLFFFPPTTPGGHSACPPPPFHLHTTLTCMLQTLSQIPFVYSFFLYHLVPFYFHHTSFTTLCAQPLSCDPPTLFFPFQCFSNLQTTHVPQCPHLYFLHLQTPHKSDTQYQHAPTTTQEQFLHFYLFTLFHTYNPAYIHQDHSYPLPTLPPHASTTDKPHTQTTDKLHTNDPSRIHYIAHHSLTNIFQHPTAGSPTTHTYTPTNNQTSTPTHSDRNRTPRHDN